MGALPYEMTSFELSNIGITEHGQTAVSFVQYRKKEAGGVSRSGDWLITDVWRRNETACQVVARDRADCLDNRYVALLYRYVRYRGEK